MGSPRLISDDITCWIMWGLEDRLYDLCVPESDQMFIQPL